MTRYKLETADAVLSVAEEYPDAVFWVRWARYLGTDRAYKYGADEISGWHKRIIGSIANSGYIEVELPDGVKP